MNVDVAGGEVLKYKFVIAALIDRDSLKGQCPSLTYCGSKKRLYRQTRTGGICYGCKWGDGREHMIVFWSYADFNVTTHVAIKMCIF